MIKPNLIEGNRSRISLDGPLMPKRQTINDSYARHLDRFNWTHFATFTTKNELGIKAARRLAETIGSKIHCHMLQSKLKMFWMAEAFSFRDVYHLHCLLYCPRPGDAEQLKKWSEKSIGTCRILPKKGRASDYVVKHIHKAHSDYDLIQAP